MNGDTNGTMGEPMDIAVPNEQQCSPELKKDDSESFGIRTLCDAALSQNQDNGYSTVTKAEESTENKIQKIENVLQHVAADNTDDSLIELHNIIGDNSTNIKDNGRLLTNKEQTNEEVNSNGSQIMQEDKPSQMTDSTVGMSNEDSLESSLEEGNVVKTKNIESLLGGKEKACDKKSTKNCSQFFFDIKHTEVNDPLLETSQNDSYENSIKLNNSEEIDCSEKNDKDQTEKTIHSKVDGMGRLQNDNIEESNQLENPDGVEDKTNLPHNKEEAYENTINKKPNHTETEDPLNDVGKDNEDEGSFKIEFSEIEETRILPTDKEKTNEIEGSTKTSHSDQNSCDDDPQLSNEGNSKNGFGSAQDSKDSCVFEDDPMGDTMFNLKMKKDDNLECSDLSDEDNGLKTETFKIVTISKHDSDEEVESIHTSDFSSGEEDHKIEDAVSIHSDSDDAISKEVILDKSSEIVILENEGTDTLNGTSKTNEVHEIVSDNDNDDCVVTAEEKPAKKMPKKETNPKIEGKVELRRSSRAIKRKKYDVDIQPLDDESDIEEVVLDDPLKRKSNKNSSSNRLVMDLTSKNTKAVVHQKKDSTVVIIELPSKNRVTPNKAVNSALNQSIYQRMASRGTSVTPISVKNSSTQATQVVQPPPSAPPIALPVQPILPTLTDDMFVVEAPSFIVPYVYEKPADVPFKEFVDNWGKEIEEETAKEEQALLEKKKEEKAKREQERKEKKERGEEVEESGEEAESEEALKKKAEKAEKKERRRLKKEDDDVSWDGSSSEESEDDSISDDDIQNMILKDKISTIGDIKPVSDLPTETGTKTDSYFDLFLGKFFMNIGLNLVQEYVQTDLLKQQNRKLQRVKRAGHDTAAQELSVGLLTKNLELSRKSNASYTFEQKKCKFCTFKTESALIMAHHMETPHMKNNLYQCNYCPFEIKNAHDILFHMETVHLVKGKLERAPALHQCANCLFEDHGKGKLARHLIACAKKFKPDSNLAPPVEWEHPAKIAKVMRPRHNATNYQVAQFGRHHVDSNSFPKLPVPVVGSPMYRGRARAPTPRLQLPAPVHVRPGGVLIRNFTTSQPNFPAGLAKKSSEPSISITPLPRQPAPATPVQPLHTANAKGFVICEICDGYIKDLDQLRYHMQWIHKVKIHPKMIYNRPPLNCQKCQFRFFTDQGLERHLLGSHGLVTSSMQEAANKGKDAGRCPVCGRVYQWKLLGHVSRDHNLILKPAHLSYKCTVCTATFGMYRQFENHVYSAHSVVAKKVIDKKTNAATAKAAANDNAAKQLKINDEITIIPQSAKTPSAAKGK